LLEVDKLTKRYDSPAGPLTVLSEVSFSLQRGEAAAIVGPSGSGKSTLLSILGALEAPSSGTVTLDGENPYALTQDALAEFRNRKIGFIFQDHCLLPQCTVLENVLIPTLLERRERNYSQRAKELLDQVGLSARLGHLPSQLSGGEKQRVAIARALIRDPLLVLCDEPTGNLDRRNGEAVAGLLEEMHRRLNNILLVVTHSAALAGRLPRCWELVDGRLTAQETR
jgi:lipoprotein-releasing system ATP-binding protein